LRGAAEAGLGVGDDRRHPVTARVALDPVDLVGPPQGVVDAARQRRGAVGRVETLVGIDLLAEVGVTGDLPAGEIDGLQSGLDHLHGLVPGHRAQGVDVVAGGQQLPEALGALTGQRVLDGDGAAQPDHLRGRVVTPDPGPTGVLCPLPLELAGGLGDLLFNGHGRVPLVSTSGGLARLSSCKS
jgi:hypothetical protein